LHSVGRSRHGGNHKSIPRAAAGTAAARGPILRVGNSGGG